MNKPTLAAVDGPADPESKAEETPESGGTSPPSGGNLSSGTAPRVFDLTKFADLWDLVTGDEETLIQAEVAKHLDALLKKHGLAGYTTILLHDTVNRIQQYHANRIYDAVQSLKGESILLILQSGGGGVEPAYLISKTCGRLGKRFVVAVPRRAKSAATLIALGADEIHMGLMSELGPVDPQIDGYPALGLISSLNVLAEIACKHKDSAELFARYLSRKLELQNLGYYARVPESAVQYGERLLKRNETRLPKGSTAQSVADRLVNHYKDHSFVIDLDEATQMLGELVKSDTPEYRAANEVYTFLNLLEVVFSIKSKDFWYVGNVAAGLGSRQRTK